MNSSVFLYITVFLFIYIIVIINLCDINFINGNENEIDSYLIDI